MWKKIGVTLIALLSTFSVVYAMNRDMFASSKSGAQTIPVKKGDKIYFGNFNNKDIAWDIMVDDSSNLVLASSQGIRWVPKCSNNNLGAGANQSMNCPYTAASPLYKMNAELNANFSSFELTYLEKHLNEVTNALDEVAFVPKIMEMYPGTGSLKINNLQDALLAYNPNLEFSYSSGYHLTDYIFIQDGSGRAFNAVLSLSGYVDNSWRHALSGGMILPYEITRSWSINGSTGGFIEAIYRPYMVTKPLSVVFGVDPTKEKDNLTEVFPSTYGLGSGSSNGALKIRLHDASLSVDVTPKTYGKVMGNSVVLLEYANASIGDDKVLSAIIRDENGVFKYFKQLSSPTSANGVVQMKMDGLPSGKYTVQLVNEMKNSDYRPTSSSLISKDAASFEVIDKLENYTYTLTPQKFNVIDMKHLEADKNVNQAQIASIRAIDKNNKIPTVPLEYEIINASGATGNVPFTFKKDSKNETIVDSNGNAIIYSNTNVPAGIYKFRVRIFDENYKPTSIDDTQGIDKNGNAVPDVNYGLVTDEIEVIVYPNENIMKFNPTYKVVEGVNKNWTTTEINNVANKVIGTASLDPNPKNGATPIFDSTMQIKYAISDVKLNGASIATGSEDFKIDEDTGDITKNGTILYGNHEFTLQVKYIRNGKTVTIDKTSCSFMIEPILYFVDEKDGATKITELSLKHDENASDHKFLVLAKSDTTTITDSPNLKYRIDPNDTTGKIKYIQQVNKKAQFETVKPGVTYIEAYYVENGIEVVVEKLKVTVSVDAITELKLTVTPQNNSTNKTMDHLSYKQNTKKDDVIAKISSKGGTKPITYNLSDATNFYLKDNPDTATNTTQKYVTDVDGNVLVYAKKDLEIGTYPLVIQAYDDLNQPFYSDGNGNTTFGIDENGNKVSGYDKGLISESYEIVVYPNDTQATLTQEKKYSGTAKEQFFTEVDIKADLTKTLGSIDFTNDAKVDALRIAGYVIQEVKLVNKATTTPYAQLKVEQDGTNKNKYNIKANSSITGGTKEFDVIITFKKSSDTAVTATITKSNQSLYIANELSFINPDKQSEFLSNKQYSKMYEPDTSKGNNLFKLLATEKLGTTNPKVKYCILKNDACDTTANSIVTLTQMNGEAEAKVLLTGTSKKELSVRAYLEDTNGVYLTSQDIDLTILPAKQALQWGGENIQVANNNITKDTTTPATWLLNLKYDEQTTPITPGLNEYAFVKAYDKTALQKGKIMIRSNVLEDNTTPAPTLSFSYAITYDVQRDRGKIDESELTNGNLVIKGELEGNVSITATSSATGDYDATINEDDPNTTVVEELGSATLRLSVTSKPKVDFKFAYTSSSIFNGDDYAKGINSLGTLSLKPSDTKYEYAISSASVLDEEATANAKKLDPLAEDVYVPYVKENFILNLNGAGTLTDQLYVNKGRIPNGLPAGTYQVTIQAEKTLDGVKLEAIPKVVMIVVKAQSIDYEKLEWQSKDSSDTSNFAPVNGILVQDTNTKEIMNSVALEMVYKGTDSNGNPGYFYVNLMDTDALTLTDTTIEYAISDDSTPNIISFQTTDDAENGKVSIHGVSTGTSISKIKATIKKTGYADLIVYLPITIKKATPEMKFVKGDARVYQLVNSKDTSLYKNLDVTYSEAGSIDVFTANANTESDITISIESTTTSTGNDVLKFKDDEATTNADKDNPKTCIITKEEYASKRLSKCQTFIENAMDKTSDKGTIIVKASTIATANYEAFTIRMPINIDKAMQDDFNFAVSDLDVESNDKGAVEPKFLEHVEGNDNLKIGKGKITLLLANSDGTPPDFTSDEVGFDPDEYDRSNEKYSDGYKTYVYNIVVGKTDPERVVHVYARKEGDRNYKASDEKELVLHVQPEGKSVFNTKIESYPAIGKPPVQETITYGDEYFSIVASSPDDEDDEKATYTYTFEDEDKDAIEIYSDNGNTNEFKPKKAKDEVVIKITRTSGTGAVVTSSPKIKIQKKMVKLKVADVEKINGQMVVANDDYTFTDTSSTFLEKDKQDIVITYSCQDDKAVEVDTLTDGIRVKHNQTPIKATITNKVANNDVLSNYSIKHLDGKTDRVEDGELIVTQEESQKTWYEVKEGSQVNDKGETIITSKGQNDWYNGNVNVLLKPTSNDYDLISNDENGKDWSSDKFTVNKNGANAVDVYFRKSSGDDKDAISKPQSETIKIDTVAPRIKEIKATLTYTDNLSKIVNALTFGMFMKPGEEVTIKTEDIQADKTIEVSTTNNVAEGMLYKAYTVDENGNRGGEYIPTTKGDTSSDGTYVFDLEDPGTYEVCAIVKDQAGNASVESCEKLLVKKIDYDGDDDGNLDYLDPDGDGCPDIDIILQDKDKKKYKINVDRDDDGIPDLNIDSDGDGIAEINVDTDKDGEPDLNLFILTKWEPTFCAKEQVDNEGKPIEYCTMKDIKPLINVDTGNDGIPDINIDTSGDMKADINIDRNDDGKLDTRDLNITGKIKVWSPDKEYTFEDFIYDTQNDLVPRINVDTTGQAKPDLNIDTDDDGLPDLNIDANGDGIPETNIDSDGDGVADFNLDPDRTGTPQSNIIEIKTWKPEVEGEIDGIHYLTMGGLALNDTLTDDDSGIQIQKPGGNFLPNYSIKVNNVKDSIDEGERSKIEEYVKGDMEIKDIYDVKLSNGTSIIQPDGSIKVRIPVSDEIADSDNVKVIIEQADGSYKEVNATVKDGYIEYETDYLGKVGIIADTSVNKDPDPDPNKPDVPIPDFTPNGSGGSTPDTNVKGNYTTGIGGAGTGDDHNVCMLLTAFVVPLSCFLMFAVKKKIKS